MRLSRLIAPAVFIGLVPLAFVLAYLGYVWGYYPYAALPFVLVGIVVLVLILLLVVLSQVRTADR